MINVAKEEFSIIFPLKNASLDYRPWVDVPLWKPRSLAEKVQHGTGAKLV